MWYLSEGQLTPYSYDLCLNRGSDLRLASVNLFPYSLLLLYVERMPKDSEAALCGVEDHSDHQECKDAVCRCVFVIFSLQGFLNRGNFTPTATKYTISSTSSASL